MDQIYRFITVPIQNSPIIAFKKKIDMIRSYDLQTAQSQTGIRRLQS